MGKRDNVCNLNVYRKEREACKNRMKMIFYSIILTSGALSLALVYTAIMLLLSPMEGIKSELLGIIFLILTPINISALRNFYTKYRRAYHDNSYRHSKFVKFTFAFFYPLIIVVILSSLTTPVINSHFLGFLLIMVMIVVSPACYRLARSNMPNHTHKTKEYG